MLKEKVDILFKLGRSYLNREKVGTNVNNDKDNKTNADDDITEVETEEESTEDLGAWTRNKLRGFKRVNPAAGASPKTPASGLPQKPSTQKPATKATPSPSGTTPGRSAPSATPNDVPPANTAARDDYYKGKYCHFFVNTGKCNFEERTGDKCKFEHKSAPACNSGMNCTRSKCMFSHPKINGINSFLGSSRGMTPAINPWQMGPMMNPWMTTTPSQFMPNPWNMQRNQNLNQQ